MDTQSGFDPIRILVVDHNRILRDGISVFIEMQAGLELVGSAATAGDGIQLFDRERPEVTLMDLDLQSGTALTAIQRIREIDPIAFVIALTTYELDEHVSRALAAGASGVLGKDQIGEMLLPLIRARRHDGRRPLEAVHEDLLHVNTD